MATIVPEGLAERPAGARFQTSPLSLIMMVLGLVAVAAPTMLFVAKEGWSTEQGSHGPIVFLTGLWLLWRLWPAAKARASAPDWRLVAVGLPVFLALYAFSRITQIVEVEGYLMYACVLIMLYSVIGWSGMRRLWFPLFYLAFIFPPPETIVAAVTLPMKMELSKAAIWFLGLFNYPIGGEGVQIFIGQYELLVAAACAGLNSIISLTAISLFYIYMRHQADWRYAGLLILFIIPVALIANFARVLTLILLTYHFGEAAAQGFLHNFAGLFMFGVALLVMYLIDETLRPVWVKRVLISSEPHHD
jgi:exosortase